MARKVFAALKENQKFDEKKLAGKSSVSITRTLSKLNNLIKTMLTIIIVIKCLLKTLQLFKRLKIFS